MSDATNELGECIDSLDSIAHATMLPMSADVHVTVLRRSLPELVEKMKAAFVAATGEDPWGI